MPITTLKSVKDALNKRISCLQGANTPTVFHAATCVQTRTRIHYNPASHPEGSRRCFPAGKVAGALSWSIAPSSAMDRIAWSSTSIPLYVLTTWYATKHRHRHLWLHIARSDTQSHCCGAFCLVPEPGLCSRHTTAPTPTPRFLKLRLRLLDF
jgi:hypothetical protein